MKTPDGEITVLGIKLVNNANNWVVPLKKKGGVVRTYYNSFLFFPQINPSGIISNGFYQHEI